MMTSLCCKILSALEGKTLVTAESCTGGGIGAALTAIPGSSKVYKGGIISYANDVKINNLSVPAELIELHGPVCAAVAEAMADGARKTLNADVAVSVTGLAGPGGDEYGNPVGTVYVGYCDAQKMKSFAYHFCGDREAVRNQAITAALQVILREA